MRTFKLLRAGVVLALLIAVGWATRVSADGTQTGVISGTVLDAAGNAVQGVEVLAAGPQIQRRGLTGGDGRFRFPALGVGSYRVTAELLGLSATAEMVAVHVSQNSDIQLQLREPGTAEAPEVEEWIQVVAEAPIVDRFDNRVGATISLEFLDQLPVQRFYQSVTLLLPGVSGGEDGNPNVSGALRSSNLFLIDGVDTTDPTTGLFGLNLGFEAIDQVEVTTAAAPASYSRASGAVINVVTRSGSNEFSGVARLLTSNNTWNEDYDYPATVIDHIRPQVDAANAGPDNIDSSLALALGGPIVLDHLWFFGAFEDTTRSFLQPSEQQGLWNEDNQLDSTTIKLSWQASPQHGVEVQHTADSAAGTTFSPFSDNPAENRLPSGGASTSGGRGLEPFPGDLFALQNAAQDGRFTKLQWNAVLSQKNSFALTLAQQDRELTQSGRNSSGLTFDAPHLAFDIAPFDGGAFIDRLVLFNGSVQEGSAKRPRDQGNLAFNSFFEAAGADHELQLGIDYQKTESERDFQTPGQAGIDRATGRPVTGQLFLDLDFSDECFFFGQCQPSFNSATGTFQPFSFFNFLRRPVRRSEEETSAFYVSDTISWDRLVVTIGARYETTEGTDSLGGTVVDDDSIVPRLSLSWDPIGDSRTLLTAAWGRYSEPFLQAYVDTFEQQDSISGYIDYEWRIDDNFCFGEDPTNLDSFCWEQVDFVGIIPVQPADPNATLSRSTVDELVVGFKRQLTPLTGLSLNYIDRTWRDLWDDVLTPTDDGGVVTDVRNLAEARREYRAVQLLVQRRFADNWQLLGSYTWSEASGNLFTNDGLDTFADFQDVIDVNLVNRFGPAPYDRPHQLGVFGTYKIPLGRSLVSLGSSLRYRDGVPYQRERDEPGGVRFLTPRGSERLSGIFQWDISADWAIKVLRELELEVRGEIFNLTNDSQQLTAESATDSGRFGLPSSVRDLQAPRSYRLTLGLRF